MSKTLAQGQRAALRGLVERGVLSDEQLHEVLAAVEGSAAGPGHAGAGAGQSGAGPAGTGSERTGLWEVLGYVGGALVLGGASLLVGMSWANLGQDARVGLLAAAAVVLLAAGVLMGGGPRGVRARAGQASSPRARIVAVLFALGSAAAAMTVSTALDSYEGVAATATGFVVALLGYLALPSLPGLLATGGFSVGVVLAVDSQWFSSSTPSVTVGLLVLGALWAALALTGRLVEESFGLAGAAAIALAGAQVPVGSQNPWWGYCLTALIALACFAGYLRHRTVVLLAFGVLGITVAVPEAVWHWARGALSGPLTVLVVGLAFLAASGIGLLLRRTRSQQES